MRPVGAFKQCTFLLQTPTRVPQTDVPKSCTARDSSSKPAWQDCIVPDQYYGEKWSPKTLYALSPMRIHIMGKTKVGIVPPDPDKADFRLDPNQFRFDEPEFNLDCNHSVETFPNACGGTVKISYKRGEEHWTTRTFGVALFVYSSYTDGKTREIVHAKFLYEEGKDNIWHECSAETKFLSGECFGMSTTREPRVPEDPPVLFIEGGREKWKPIHVVQPPPTPEPTPAPTPAGGGGAGTVILILLILALIGGAAAFFLRRQRLMQEEQSLRNAREVELN